LNVLDLVWSYRALPKSHADWGAGAPVASRHWYTLAGSQVSLLPAQRGQAPAEIRRVRAPPVSKMTVKF
jgi:hypothetical protein